MSKFFRNCLALSSVFTVVLPVFTAKDSGAEPGLKVIVRVYNYAQVSPKTLAEATTEATTIFLDAGLEMLWLDCRLSLEDSHGDRACLQPFGPTDLVLRILPQSKHKAYRDDTFGVSLPSMEEERGFIANIFWDRIEELTKWSQVSPFQVLSLVAAHEIGHLLIGLNAHAPKGIMRADWNRHDLQRASQGLLRFTPKQCELIRAGVRARNKKIEASSVSEDSPNDRCLHR
jgi:hypothetical protein